MSNQKNHRRGHDRIQENGPRYENGCPAKGCNSTHVARARRSWKELGRRRERRTGKEGANGAMYDTRGHQAPEVNEDWGGHDDDDR